MAEEMLSGDPTLEHNPSLDDPALDARNSGDEHVETTVDNEPAQAFHPRVQERQIVVHRGFAAEIRRVVIFTIICIVIGLIFGYLTWTLIIGGTLYMSWTLWQIWRLDRWIINKEPGLPPDATGIWGDIFDRIYHLQKRQDREKQLLKGVVNRIQDTTAALPDAVVLLDERGNMTWWNQTATDLMGFVASDKNYPITNFVRNPRFVKYFDKGKYKEPISLTSPSDENKRIQIQITRYGQGERLVLIRDITRVHRLEQMRKDFVANVSHELRTPLTVIKGYLETFTDYADEVPPKFLNALKQMQQQSDRMTLLVNDLIALSKLETEDTENKTASVPLRSLLQRICGEAEVVGKDKGFKFILNCNTEKSLRGSEKELHSAFSNLVTNAMKYSPEGGEIVIAAHDDSRGLQVSVTDHGIGIDAVHIPRLTERFYRVDKSRSINTGGTGLGLAIVKHILVRHDARLSITSTVGEGSVFTCTFPLRRVVSV